MAVVNGDNSDQCQYYTNGKFKYLLPKSYFKLQLQSLLYVLNSEQEIVKRVPTCPNLLKIYCRWNLTSWKIKIANHA